MRTLADIPLEVRFDSAMASANAFRAAAGQQHGRLFDYRRGLLLNKAKRMEAIAAIFLHRAQGMSESDFDADAYMKQPSVVAAREEFEERIKDELISDEGYVKIDALGTADLEKERLQRKQLELDIAEATAYKKRRRQKDSFVKKMREFGYEPVMDPGRRPTPDEVAKFQAPENWRRA